MDRRKIQIKPKHYVVKSDAKGTDIEYQIAIAETNFIRLTLAEHVRQFVFLLKAAGYKEQKDD